MTSKYLTLQVSNNNIAKVNPCTIISWNVDGYTEDVHTWLLLLAKTSRPDIIFLSETKKSTEYLSGLFDLFTEYNYIVNAHNPARWHGVAMLIRKDHSYEHIPVQMNIAVRSDAKSAEAAIGRIIVISLDKQLYVVGTYTPNSGRDNDVRLDYRTKIWDPTFFNLLEQLRIISPTAWIGDINVALEDIDVSNPKTMKKYAGFTAEERANFRALLNTGEWIDIWRQQHPNDRIYTWCGSPPRADYGLRLDNIVISKSLLPSITNTFMISKCPISADHIPVGVCITLN